MSGMSNNIAGMQKHRALEYILCYVIWILMAGTSIWLLIDAQSNMMLFVRMSASNPAMVTVINDTSLIVLGFAALAFIILLEHYLRIGVEKGKFWPRLARAIMLEAIILAVAYIGAPILLRVLLKT